jgi:hypothetical protein
MRDGSRGLDLNDRLCRHAWACDTFDELLDVARTIINVRYPVPLDDAEVVKRAQAVWNDRPKLQRWEGRPSSSKAEAKHLSTLGQHGGDAALLLQLLRAEHAARVRRGETFAISPKAMAHTALSWTAARIRNARNTLLASGYIKVVTAGGRGRIATRYTLVPGE